MRHSTFASDMSRVLYEGRLDKLSVGYGAKSLIAKSELMEPLLAYLRGEDNGGILTTIRVEDANHSWGDELPVLAKLYLRALT